jgi:hypothetical protein
VFFRVSCFRRFSILFVATAFLCASEAHAAVWFVTQAGSGDRSGSDWDNACGEAQLPAKIQSAATGDELWVAKGVYRPSTTGNTSAYFALKTGVALYGGFGGTETDRSERNVGSNPAILTGDLANDDEAKVDGVTVSADWIRGNNSRCVVVGSGVDGSAILDGFTITAGNNLANGAPAHGGGMYVLYGSPKVRDCTFAGNNAASKGGGVFNESANPSLTNCSFRGNRAGEGGGIGNEGSGNFTISGCAFSGNCSGSGGGIFNTSSYPRVINCTFSENSAFIVGGGIYNYDSDPSVVNCTFFGNTAAIPPWEAAASAEPHGDIAPKGETVVRNNTDRTFTVSPDFGYDIAAVAGDDVPVGAVTSYTFPGIIADHAIHASFEPVPTPTPVPTIPPTPTLIPTPTVVPTASPGPSATPTTTPTGGPTPSPTSAPTGSPDPTSTPKPSVSPTPTLVPHPSPDPDIPLPEAALTLTLASGGRIIVGPWDIFDTKARLELLESPSLWAQLLAADPEALAAGDFNIGLVRFLSFVAEFDRDELEITVLFTVTVGDAPAGYRAVVFLLMRTFDASGKPAGYVVVPKSEGKSVF